MVATKLVSVLVCLSTVLAIPGRFRAQDAPRAPSNLPFAVQGPPPGWIEPGLRLTYETLIGSLPDGEYAYRADAGGRWVDEQGNRYARSEVEAQGSHGFLQVRVAAIGRDEVALQMLFFLVDGAASGAPVQNLELGGVAAANTGGDLWLHPDALRALLDKGAAGCLVSRVDHRIELAEYEAVLIVAARTSGKSAWVFDLDSGVLLYASDITRLAGQRDAHGVDLAPGGLQVRFTSFRASRTVKTPWAGRQAPLAKEVQSLDYRGRFVVRQVGASDTPLPFDLRLTARQRGAGYVLFDVAGPNATPGLDLRVSGDGLLAGLWIPPAGFAALRAGQVLDRDPITGVETRVAQVDREVLVLVEDGPRQRIERAYRARDGALVRFVSEEPFPNVPGMSKVVEMELAGMR
jgi:hypothetical protein